MDFVAAQNPVFKTELSQQTGGSHSFFEFLTVAVGFNDSFLPESEIDFFDGRQFFKKFHAGRLEVPKEGHRPAKVTRGAVARKFPKPL